MRRRFSQNHEPDSSEICFLTSVGNSLQVSIDLTFKGARVEPLDKLVLAVGEKGLVGAEDEENIISTSSTKMHRQDLLANKNEVKKGQNQEGLH